jgi:alcohol dehydrogenase
MLAVHLDNGKVTVRRLPPPRRKPGHALIRVLAAGICNTDLELQRGYYHFSGCPGHEFVGEVVDSDRHDLLGRRVVGEINLPCRRCPTCARNLERHCPRRRVLGILRHPGAFAEFLTLPDANLHLLPPAIPTDEAVFVEPLAAACEILEQINIPRQAPVAVLGDGKLGLLISQLLAARQFHVTQFGRHLHKLRIARQAGIATRLVKDKLPQAAFDWVIEATGSAAGLAAAVHLTRPRGTVVMKSTVHGAVPLHTAPIVVNEITLIGSRCGPFPPAIQLLARRQINVASMITAAFPLAQAPDAFAAAARGALKILIRP